MAGSDLRLAREAVSAIRRCDGSVTRRQRTAVHGDGPIALNAGRERRALTVVNTGDRPVQVGSHYHFAESNPALDFDREAAWGTRLAVPAGTAVRFEPGIPREVEVVPIAGRRIVPGLRGASGGRLDGASA